MNPDVDSYAKTLNHRKIIGKRKKQQPTENQTNTKTEISRRWRSGFHIQIASGGIRPSVPRQLRHWL